MPGTWLGGNKLRHKAVIEVVASVDPATASSLDSRRLLEAGGRGWGVGTLLQLKDAGPCPALHPQSFLLLGPQLLLWGHKEGLPPDLLPSYLQ